MADPNAEYRRKLQQEFRRNKKAFIPGGKVGRDAKKKRADIAKAIRVAARRGFGAPAPGAAMDVDQGNGPVGGLGGVNLDALGPAPLIDPAHLPRVPGIFNPKKSGGLTHHPLARIKQRITEYLPHKYWSQYPIDYNFGPGRPHGRRIATKIKWKKLLGDVFAINGMTRFKPYSNKPPQAYQSRERWKQGIGHRTNYKNKNRKKPGPPKGYMKGVRRGAAVRGAGVDLR